MGSKERLRGLIAVLKDNILGSILEESMHGKPVDPHEYQFYRDMLEYFEVLYNMESGDLQRSFAEYSEFVGAEKNSSVNSSSVAGSIYNGLLEMGLSQSNAQSVVQQIVDHIGPDLDHVSDIQILVVEHEKKSSLGPEKSSDFLWD